MKKKIMHQQSVVIESFIASTPNYNLNRFLDDMGVERAKPEVCKTYIKESTAMKRFDISRGTIRNLVKDGKLKQRYVADNPNLMRFLESDFLDLINVKK